MYTGSIHRKAKKMISWPQLEDCSGELVPNLLQEFTVNIISLVTIYKSSPVNTHLPYLNAVFSDPFSLSTTSYHYNF